MSGICKRPKVKETVHEHCTLVEKVDYHGSTGEEF